MKVRPWPPVGEQGRWILELMEELLANTSLSHAELSDQAATLREEARTTGLEAYREASLALADRYDVAAATRARTE